MHPPDFIIFPYCYANTDILLYASENQMRYKKTGKYSVLATLSEYLFNLPAAVGSLCFSTEINTDTVLARNKNPPKYILRP